MSGNVTKLVRSFVNCVLCLFTAVVTSQSVVQVLGASSKQQIDGFGCSLAFMGQVIQNLPSTPRASILQTLFSTSSGAGFSILRTRVSPYLSTSPGQYDYVSDTEEVGTRYLVNQAKTFGVSRFLASVWTPPTYSKTPPSVNGGSIDNSVASFTNYAAFLSDYVKTYDQTYGIQWYAISPQNEPEIQTPYESCQWTSTDFVTFLGTYLRPRFIQDSITALVLAPESNEWQEYTIAPTLNSGTARAGVQIVAAHPYFAGEIVSGGIQTSGYDYFPLSKKWGKQLWATEFSNISSSSDTITESIRVATLVHKQLTVPESNAFLFWWGATDQVETTTAQGLISFDSSGTFVVRKRLWALGQFARFIRPGWRRIDATAEPVKGVHITVFKDGLAQTQVVIVAINENTAASSIKFNLYGIQVSTVAGYRTSSTQSLASIGNSAVSQGTFTVNLAAQSITTFVGITNSNAVAFTSPSASFITEFNSLSGSAAASGDLTNKFSIGTIDPSTSGYDETALFRQTNTAEYIDYPITSTAFTSFVLSVQRNAYSDGLSFAAVSSSGTLTTLTAVKSGETAQPGFWFVYTYSITSVPTGTVKIRIKFSATNAEWNPRLTRLVIT